LKKFSNDIALFSRLRKNDRLALKTLFANYYQKLCSLACTYLDNAEESEEAVADVFVNLWKNRLHLDIQKNFRAYIYTAVKHACMAQIKKQKPGFVEITDSIENAFTGPETRQQNDERKTTWISRRAVRRYER
jgi:RNA polymerase sigma-70 factor, ECF subfamily